MTAVPRAKGTHVHNLTNHRINPCSHLDPNLRRGRPPSSLSGSGRRLAFGYADDQGGGIAMISSHGTSRHHVTDTFFGGDPAWAASGVSPSSQEKTTEAHYATRTS